MSLEQNTTVADRFAWKTDCEVCTPIQSYTSVFKLKSFHPAWQDHVLNLSHKSNICYSGRHVQCHLMDTDISERRERRSNVPKTIFCHDMKGGYLEDRFVNGSSKHEEYRFFHWAGIDTFIYFSHQLVTIPPPVWINSAHLHGTKILGTLITEWKGGEAVWKEIMESDKTVEEFVDSLVAICSNFCFDGYLLNVENVIPAEHVSRLELFVGMLHNRLHAKIPHAELIWYDSVTIKGELKWQNELNELNRVFFDNCDGIFLNYTWKEENLQKSAENAGARHLDVYVGVDVFGRNCFGGGGFNSCQAVELARKYKLSVALFAAGWVHEYFNGTHFLDLEYAFWQKLWPYLYICGPTKLPFSTTFCQGYGKKLYCKGQVVSNAPWYNLSKQQYQPTVASCLGDKFVEPMVKARKDDGNTDRVKDEVQKLITAGCVQHCPLDAYTGGGCLQIRKPSSERHGQRILVCSFDCDGQILVSVATKATDENKTSLNVLLLTEDSKAVCSKWILLAHKPKECSDAVDDKHVFPLEQKQIDELKHQVENELLDDLSSSAACDWKLRHYVLELHETIVEIGVQFSGSSSSVLLGLLRIVPLKA